VDNPTSEFEYPAARISTSGMERNFEDLQQ
jgi:hypothetical protein